MNQDLSGWRLALPEIQTDRLLLSCPQAQDGPKLYAAISESLPELKPWFAWTANLILTPESIAVSAAYARDRFLSAKEVHFYIFANYQKTLLGICGLAKHDCLDTFTGSYWNAACFMGKII